MTTTTINQLCNAQLGKLKAIAASVILLTAGATAANAQTTMSSHDEQYGHTLNLGVGIGYYGYLNQDVPFIFANYEFDVARSFTLAPFIGFSSYRSDRYYDGRYYYHETIVPMGVKGTYYFDKILGAGPAWDFYLAASLGFVYDHVSWDDGYTGDRNVYHGASPLYLDGHIGAEYHINKKVGLFLDLSTGVSTFGLAVHGMHSK